MSITKENDKLHTSKDQLKSCLQMMRNSSDDNEKMASLLLFTHLMKANPELSVDSKELFHAIDVNFLARLLNSTNVPDGCPEFMYKSLALNVLSSFTQNELLSHPLLLANLNSIIEALSMHQTAEAMFDDAAAILLILTRSSNGCENLLKSKCIPVICKSIVQNPNNDKLFEILLGILFHVPKNSWNENNSELLEITILFSTQFTESQDLLKFGACEKLLALLTSLLESQFDSQMFPDKSKDGIRQGLNDILQSRCKVKFKYTAIKLTKIMIELFGFEWMVIQAREKSNIDVESSKFMLVTLSIINTELRLIFGLEHRIEHHSGFVVASYTIIEKLMEFMICQTEGGNMLSNEVITKIHLLLTDTFDNVIQFLISLGSAEHIEKPSFQQPIVMATVRVLCVWLSEETNALADKISQVLPILINWAKLDQNCTRDEDNLVTNKLAQNQILLHMLPPLCHLSADEHFCGILVKHDCHVLLAKLFKQLWQMQQDKYMDYPSHLITLCNVLLNLCILEVDLVKTTESFGNILDCILSTVPKMLDSRSATLTAHFVLIGLMLFRHRSNLNNPELITTQKEFIRSIIIFLKQVYLAVIGEQTNACMEWNDVSELWFLSVQNLVACAKTTESVKRLVLDSSWPQEIKEWMTTSKSSFQDMKSALLPLTNLI